MDPTECNENHYGLGRCKMTNIGLFHLHELARKVKFIETVSSKEVKRTGVRDILGVNIEWVQFQFEITEKFSI